MDKQEVREFLYRTAEPGVCLLVNELVDYPTDDNLETLENFLFVEDPGTFSKHFTATYVPRMFLALEEDGLRRLARLYLEAPGLVSPGDVLNTIFCASQKRYVPFLSVHKDAKPFIRFPEITDAMASLAQELFTDIVIQSRTNKQQWPFMIDMLPKVLHSPEPDTETHLYGGATDVTEAWFYIVLNSTFALTKKTIVTFEKMIEDILPEERYQAFLASNPVLLDPLAKRVIGKQELGSEFVTDFVIEKLDGSYILVEIEKPSDNLFTQNNDFTAGFTHAYGQLLDFQEWVESNIAYAQRQMPGIVAPVGLLIMGRRSLLTEQQARKLARFNTNINGRVRVMCFDDVVANANKLYTNMYREN